MRAKLETNRSRPHRKAKQTRKRAWFDRSTSLPKLKRILVPIDFSESSLKALRYAVPFAERFGATIYLVHIIETSFFIADVQNIALALPQSKLVENAREKLFSLADREIAEIVPVSIQVRPGKPFDQIAATAKELDVDLIIIATHGYTGLKRVVLGSTAERVIRHAPCPVLTVREHEREFV